MTKTALDIYLAAHTAAAESLTITDPFDLEQFRANAFATGGNDKADYADFEKQFNDHRATMQNLAKQKPRSATAPLGPAGVAAANAPAAAAVNN